MIHHLGGRRGRHREARLLTLLMGESRATFDWNRSASSSTIAATTTAALRPPGDGGEQVSDMTPEAGESAEPSAEETAEEPAAEETAEERPKA
jgi:hypothetical protein